VISFESFLREVSVASSEQDYITYYINICHETEDIQVISVIGGDLQAYYDVVVDFSLV
jgi:hypothetical protein